MSEIDIGKIFSDAATLSAEGKYDESSKLLRSLIAALEETSFKNKKERKKRHLAICENFKLNYLNYGVSQGTAGFMTEAIDILQKAIPAAEQAFEDMKDTKDGPRAHSMGLIVAMMHNTVASYYASQEGFYEALEAGKIELVPKQAQWHITRALLFVKKVFDLGDQPGKVDDYERHITLSSVKANEAIFINYLNLDQVATDSIISLRNLKAAKSALKKVKDIAYKEKADGYLKELQDNIIGAASRLNVIIGPIESDRKIDYYIKLLKKR